ncbi:MAG: hypothetical protein HQM00_05715 [Magnetococcales bacterium]|nr:hypothetical protein [Magnetococcales bacterium]
MSIDFGFLIDACLEHFGTSMIYTRSGPGGVPTAVSGILTDTRKEASLMGAGFSGFDAVIPNTRIEMRSDALGFTPAEGDLITVDGTNYRVRSAFDDGFGSIIIVVDLQHG